MRSSAATVPAVTATANRPARRPPPGPRHATAPRPAKSSTPTPTATVTYGARWYPHHAVASSPQARTASSTSVTMSPRHPVSSSSPLWKTSFDFSHHRDTRPA